MSNTFSIKNLPNLLISLCKSDDQDRSLLFYQSEKARGFYVAGAPPRCKGATGIATWPDGYIVGCQSRKYDTSVLWFLDYRLRTVQHRGLRLTRDIHSIQYSDRHLYCVSTGNNAIVKVGVYKNDATGRIVTRNEQVIDRGWHVDLKMPEDKVHLNSYYFYNKNTQFAAMFGPDHRKGLSLKGSIWKRHMDHRENLGTGLHHPHTLKWVDKSLIYCESGKSLFMAPGRRPIYLDGYTRGIAWDDKFFYVGISGNRVQSKTTGAILQPLFPGVTAGVWVIERATLKTLYKIDLSDYTTEIYDIEIIGESHG